MSQKLPGDPGTEAGTDRDQSNFVAAEPFQSPSTYVICASGGKVFIAEQNSGMRWRELSSREIDK
jgi:hypothetical protein